VVGGWVGGWVGGGCFVSYEGSVASLTRQKMFINCPTPRYFRTPCLKNFFFSFGGFFICQDLGPFILYLLFFFPSFLCSFGALFLLMMIHRFSSIFTFQNHIFICSFCALFLSMMIRRFSFIFTFHNHIFICSFCALFFCIDDDS
jgi:hypothetical protein